MTTKTTWFIRGDAATDSTARLFVFPHGGGSPSQYRDWGKRLGQQVEVHVASLPGRGARFREEPISDMACLIDRLAAAIPPLLCESNFFFGHSLGAVVAYELLKTLTERGQILAKKLIVSAKNAPHMPTASAPLSPLNDDLFVEALRLHGGTPPEVLADKELMELCLPMLRADFRMSENYLCQEINALDCEISIFGAKDDPLTTLDGLKQWSRYACGECDITLFGGGHFYFHAEQENFFSALRQVLASSQDTPPKREEHGHSASDGI